MADLTTLEAAKQYLRIAQNKDDELLTRLITACTHFIETYCGRSLMAKDHQEVFSGRSLGYHMCKNGPVISATAKGDGKDLAIGLSNGFMVTLDKGASFPQGFYNCILTYRAGYEVPPPDLEQACLELVGIKYKTIEHLDVSQKSMQGETVSYIVKDMPDYVKVILKPYRKMF